MLCVVLVDRMIGSLLEIFVSRVEVLGIPTRLCVVVVELES